jgi:Histidine kinase-like ATPase domain
MSSTPGDAVSPGSLSLSVPTRTEHIGTVRSFIAAAAAHFGLAEEPIEDLKLAVSEICADANEAPADGRILVHVTGGASALEIQIAGLAWPLPEATRGADPTHVFRRRLIDALIPEAVFTPSDDGAAVRFTVARAS